MDVESEVDRWIDRLRTEISDAGKSAAELSRRLGKPPGFLRDLLAGRRRLTVGTAFRLVGELQLSPGTFCDRLYQLPGWHLELGELLHRPLLADLGEPVDGEPSWAELWSEALAAEARRVVDVAVELEALRKLLEARIRDRREGEAAVQKRAGLKGKALERFLSAEADLAVADLFRVLEALQLPPVSFFGDLFPVPGHEYGADDLTTPSWTEVLALADRLLAGITESDEFKNKQTSSLPAAPPAGEQPPDNS